MIVEAGEVRKPGVKFNINLEDTATVADLKDRIYVLRSREGMVSPKLAEAGVWFSLTDLSPEDKLANRSKGIRESIDIPYPDNKRISDIPKPEGLNYYIVRYGMVPRLVVLQGATTEVRGQQQPQGQQGQQGLPTGFGGARGGRRKKSRKRKSKRRKRSKKSKRSKRSKRR